MITADSMFGQSIAAGERCLFLISSLEQLEQQIGQRGALSTFRADDTCIYHREGRSVSPRHPRLSQFATVATTKDDDLLANVTIHNR